MHVISINYIVSNDGQRYAIRDWASAGMEAAEVDANGVVGPFREVHWYLFCENRGIDPDVLCGAWPPEVVLVLDEDYGEKFQLSPENPSYEEYIGDHRLLVTLEREHIRMTVEVVGENTSTCIFNETFTDASAFERELRYTYERIGTF
jgi:hypothetical protein